MLPSVNKCIFLYSKKIEVNNTSAGWLNKVLKIGFPPPKYPDLTVYGMVSP